MRARTVVLVPVAAGALAATAGLVLALGRPARRDAAEAAPASPIALVGRWRLDTARTHYGQGVDVRQREEFSCELADARLRCVMRSVRRSGQSLVGDFSAAPDGAAAFVRGLPDIDSVRVWQRAAGVTDATFSFHGRPVFAYRAYRSAYGAWLTIVAVNPESGAALTSAVVYGSY